MRYDNDLTLSWATLEDLIELVIDYRGKTPKKLGGNFAESGVPVISAIHIKRGNIIWEERERFVSKEMFQKWMKEPLKKNDVLLTSEAPLGEVALVPTSDELVLSQRLFALRTKPELLDPRFLMYFFQSALGQEALKSRSSGSTVIGIRQAELLKIEIPIPSLSEQKAIGDFLEALDSFISVNEQIAKCLEEIAQVLFNSWFIDFDPVKAKMAGEEPAGIGAETATLFPSSMADSEIGLIPEGWSVIPVGEALEVKGGATPSTKNSAYWGGEFTWTTPKDLSVQQGLITTGSARTLTREGLAKVSSGLLPVNSVLMSCRAPIGYLSINAVPTAVNQGCITLGNSENLSPLFVLNWIRANMQEVLNRAGGGTFAEISRKSFKEIPILLPSTEISEAYSAIANPILAQLENLSRENETLIAIRDSLLPRLISGELQFREEKLVV
jgi:type I restriction enzyme S subunit